MKYLLFLFVTLIAISACTPEPACDQSVKRRCTVITYGYQICPPYDYDHINITVDTMIIDVNDCQVDKVISDTERLQDVETTDPIKQRFQKEYRNKCTCEQ